MRTRKIVKKCMAVCLALGLFMTAGNPQAVRAEEAVTVQGTVQSGTTSELLLLSTDGGRMEIKLDSGTDTSGCKILLPGKKISVSVVHGSDEYLHATRLSTDEQVVSLSIDTSSAAAVTGTISDKTKGDVLYFNTPQGEMQIKLDTTTNMSGCSVLVVDKSYSIVCARGSDAYMHAISISDSSSAAAGTGTVDTSITPAPASAVTAKTMSVTGTVSDKTKENLLYLSTNDGEMQIVIDNNTDSRNGLVLTSGRKLSVSVYNGSDAYLHAASITGTKESVFPAQIDMNTKAEVSGTVGSKSTENILFLKTPQGEMELKLDALSSVVGCKVFVSGKKLTVTCARGADAYMHALDIKGM
ncbi:MAG: hypothetical protein NC429_07130 [Lachnospiraceae bacterium]|nr:hypothetical protein [Lachnospiraceae bacterium]